MTTPNRRPAYRTTRRILGYVVQLRSNERAIIDLADVAFGVWPRTRRAPDVRLHFEVHAREAASIDAALDYALPPGGRLVIRGPALVVHADGARGAVRASLSRDYLQAPHHLRYGVLEAATLFLLTLRDRTPFHAAAVARAGTAVLIAGPSGAGKSTCALAAARAGTGWSILSEDCVYLQLEPRPRVWGWPGYVHLDSDAPPFFAGLGAGAPAVRAAGKRKIAISAAHTARHRPWVRRAILCLLDRSAGSARIEPIDRDDAVRALTSRLEPGFDLFAQPLPGALTRVTEALAWRLDPGPDPARVADLLERVLDTPSRIR